MIRNVVFDFGNVLVNWDPFGALKCLFGDRSYMDERLAEIDFFDWNKEQDRGRSWEEGFSWVRRHHPNHMEIFEAYHRNIQHAHIEPIEGMAKLVGELAKNGVQIFGLTNASELAFQCVRRTCPYVDDFSDILISAREGLVKPDPKIFERLLARNGLEPRETIFVDDSEANCIGASSVGLIAHRFVGAKQLRVDLALGGHEPKS